MIYKWRWFYLSLCVLSQQINGLFGGTLYPLLRCYLWHHVSQVQLQCVPGCVCARIYECMLLWYNTGGKNSDRHILVTTYTWRNFSINGTKGVIFLISVDNVWMSIPSKILVPQTKRCGHSAICGWYPYQRSGLRGQVWSSFSSSTVW